MREQRDDRTNGQGRVRRTDAPGAVTGLLALQRTAGNAAVARALDEQQRADHGHGRPAQRTATPETASAAYADRAFVQRMPADRQPPPVPPKPENLTVKKTAEPTHDYTCAGPVGQMTFYRADTRPPELIRKTNGMRSWEPASLSTELTTFLSRPREYSQEHVRSPNKRLVSMALNEECGGFASSDRHIYTIQVSGMYQFDAPPARSKLLTKPTLFANSDSLETATVIIMAPVGATDEMDYFGDIPVSHIVACRKPGESGYEAM
ncbi:hypothetical protein ACFYQA_11775 [Streptomyces sp. NPDC005774]|uniref:hypothetical protein n=1 Tax=Streptomyces sp. NPDC005774 TaxID=3364728 RepID=UPI00367F0B74